MLSCGRGDSIGSDISPALCYTGGLIFAVRPVGRDIPLDDRTGLSRKGCSAGARETVDMKPPAAPSCRSVEPHSRLILAANFHSISQSEMPPAEETPSSTQRPPDVGPHVGAKFRSVPPISCSAARDRDDEKLWACLVR